jgi:hypothetical protein
MQINATPQSWFFGEVMLVLGGLAIMGGIGLMLPRRHSL